MADVFISYSEGDASPLVEKIAVALDRAGISCWYMGRNSKHGRYAEIIAREIENCSVFLLILNEKSNRSRHTQNEITLAFQNEKEILPFRVDNCKLSHYMRYFLASFTIITANPPQEGDIRELVAQIADILGKDPPHITPTPKVDKIDLLIALENSGLILESMKKGFSQLAQIQENLQSMPPPKIDPPNNLPQPDPPLAKIIIDGKCGDDVTYRLDEYGVLTISGEGPMWDFKRTDNMPWWDEREMISCAQILNGVTSIGEHAFHGCTALTSIEIPNSVTSIKFSAFHGCKELTCVEIPDSITSIGWYVFDGCYNLKSVSVPAEVGIGDDAFPPTTKIIRRPRK